MTNIVQAATLDRVLKDDNSNIVNVMTIMNTRNKQQPQIMIMIKINQTIIMNITTTMNIMNKQTPQSVQEICVQGGFAISAVKRGIFYNVQRGIDVIKFLIKICVLDPKQVILIKTHKHG